MAVLKKTIFMVVALTVFIIALLAVADNSDEVTLKFLDYKSPLWPVSWWMMLAFVAGLLFGFLLNLVSNTRLKMDVRTANKVAADRGKALEQAQSAATGDKPS